MISICRRFKFDAAHHLPFYIGKCCNVHGHRWILDVEVSGQVQDQGPNTGMIIDFSLLKEIVNQNIIDKLDHTDLNLSLTNPTAELMIMTITFILQNELSRNNLVLERLRLYETEDSYAEWRLDK